jgi:hypothetical protein
MGPLIRGNGGHCEGMKRAQTAIHLFLGHGVASAAPSPLLAWSVSLGDEGRRQSQMTGASMALDESSRSGLFNEADLRVICMQVSYF